MRVWSAQLAEPVLPLLTTGFLGKQYNALKAKYNFKQYDLAIERVQKRWDA